MVNLGLDFSTLDSFPYTGQYRYAINLCQGLHALTSRQGEPKINFILCGSNPVYPAELNNIFSSCQSSWKYHCMKRYSCRGALALNSLSYSHFINMSRISLWHGLHDFIPFGCRIPVVLTIHDLMCELFKEYDSVSKSLAHRYARWSARHTVSHLIAVSSATLDDAVRLWGIPQDKISVVHHGTNFISIKAGQASLKIRQAIENNGAPVISSYYNLEPRKNLISLVSAMPAIRQRYPGTRLVLFGKAAWGLDREKEFNRVVGDLGLADAILRLGRVDDQDLAELYASSDCFVFPSLYEGFGLPIVEAMSQGACVLAYDSSAIAEVAGDGAFLTKDISRVGIEDAVIKILGEEYLSAEKRLLARKRAEYFSIEPMAELTMGVYRKVLGINKV